MRMLKRALRMLKRLADRLLGTLSDEIWWRLRSDVWGTECLSPESLAHPHRAFLIDTIARHAPFTRILEIGAASGPNLYHLAKRFPHAQCTGLDINSKAVRAGNAWFRKQGLANATLLQGKADALSRFADKSV